MPTPPSPNSSSTASCVNSVASATLSTHDHALLGWPRDRRRWGSAGGPRACRAGRCPGATGADARRRPVQRRSGGFQTRARPAASSPVSRWTPSATLCCCACGNRMWALIWCSAGPSRPVWRWSPSPATVPRATASTPMAQPIGWCAIRARCRNPPGTARWVSRPSGGGHRLTQGRRTADRGGDGHRLTRGGTPDPTRGGAQARE